MTVKNIMFSGVMAAILMAGANAHAAVQIASQKYVDTEVAKKADGEAFTALKDAVESTTDGLATKASQADLSALSSVVGNADSGLVKDVAANAEAIANVYTKTEADNLLATKADVDNVLAKSESYTAAQVDAKISETIASLESGGSIELGGYAKTQDVNDALALKADKTAVEAITTSLEDYAKTTDVESKDAATLESAKGYTDEKVGALTGENGAITTLAARVTVNEGAIAANATEIAKKADKTTVEGIQSTIDSLGDTYATDAEVEGIQTTLQNNINAKVATADYNTKVQALESSIASNKTATETNATAIQNINDSDVMKSGITEAKRIAYDDAVTELANKITMPKICQSTNCVLSTLNGVPTWVEITIPVGE